MNESLFKFLHLQTHLNYEYMRARTTFGLGNHCLQDVVY